VRREQVVEVLREALLPLSWVNAAWLGGSDAFGRSADLAWPRPAVLPAARHARDLRRGRGRVRAVRPRRYYNQPERHGRPLVLFDRAGAVRPVPLDQAELAATLAAAVAGIRERLPFTLPQVAKEVRRGDALAALASYHRYVLAPLAMLYRVRHAPARHDFGSRYTRDDLPPEVQQTLAELSFVADLDDLAAKAPRAERLLRELLDELG
jgi:hypothetical protein